MAEPRITRDEMPSRQVEVEFKLPYTHYGPPAFDKPEYIYEVQWHEKAFGGFRLVVSRFYFDSLEKAYKAYAVHKRKWYGPLKNPLDKKIERETKKLLALARESRKQWKRTEENLKDFYPIRLREYMAYLRRAKWVRDKRRREREKILSMGIYDGTIYIEQQIQKIREDKDE